MHLQAPVTYWSNKAKVHRAKELWGIGRLVIFFPVALTALGWAFWESATYLLNHAEKPGAQTPPALYIIMTGGLVVLSTLLFWIGRLLTKLYLSEHHLRNDADVPGFGHPIYADGDPRAKALLTAFRPSSEHSELVDAVLEITGKLPNIDFAATALSEAAHLPDDAPFQIFATARCTGWIAHALEQSRTGRLIRPRARYIGIPPVAA